MMRGGEWLMRRVAAWWAAVRARGDRNERLSDDDFDARQW